MIYAEADEREATNNEWLRIKLSLLEQEAEALADDITSQI